jgi:hypothetical protein
MADVLAQDDVLSPQYDISQALAGSRYDAGPSAPLSSPPPQAAPPQAAPPLVQPTQGPAPAVARQPVDLTQQIAQERQRAEVAFQRAERGMG